MHSVQDEQALPSEMERWGGILITRLQCSFDTFSIFTPYAIMRARSMLLELYPGDTDLTARLKDEIERAKQRSSDVNGVWLQVCLMFCVFALAHSSSTPCFVQVKMLCDGYLLHLEKPDREAMEKAIPELESSCEDVTKRVTALLAGKRRWEASYNLVLPEVNL